MFTRLLPLALAALLVAGSPADAQPLRVPLTASSATALDRYVAAPDPAYRWRVVSTRQEGDLTVTAIEMTSQAWRTPAEVDRPEWTHVLTVLRPSTVSSDTSMLFIGGGSNGRTDLPKTDPMLAAFATRTNTIVTELRMVPNQPLTFFEDGVARKEDDLIAYGWNQFLAGGDERWLARFPMTKAAVRAMDTVQAFAQSPEGGRRAITKFVVAGGSKRGWTTWTTAAVDSRVVAIMPAVIDLLNVQPSFAHHWQAYGFWAPAVGDYSTHGIMDRMGTPRFAEMARAYSGCEVWEQDFLELDLPAAYFDGVFANAALFHVPKQALPRVLRELHVALKPGGVLFSSNPRGNNEEGWNKGRYAVYHDLEAWHGYMTGAGFVELGHYYRPAGLPCARQPWLARVWRRPTW